jgi:hypothetical protein
MYQPRNNLGKVEDEIVINLSFTAYQSIENVLILQLIGRFNWSWRLGGR